MMAVVRDSVVSCSAVRIRGCLALRQSLLFHSKGNRLSDSEEAWSAGTKIFSVL